MSCIDSSLWVKICGLMQPEQAVAIARLGADAIGFIGVRSSPRYVTPLQIRAISEALMADGQDGVERVGVFANAALDEMTEAVQVGRLTGLQLHGQEPPEFCAQMREIFPDLKLIKALRIRATDDLAAVGAYEAIVDRVLLDAYHPHLLGGTGKTLDWETLRTFQPRCSWVLAGGLTPDNVSQALVTLSPFGIDLSSGVEASPGNKSLDKVTQLFAVLRSSQPAVS